jgi:hypothetical protein
MQQQGAEIKLAKQDMVVRHLTKDGKEYWIKVSASRDDGDDVTEVAVGPFKSSLTAPSGNDFRLLGHMPGYVAEAPTKKAFRRTPISDRGWRNRDPRRVLLRDLFGAREKTRAQHLDAGDS